jgi:predicted nucleotidyltransferase component of viral defense system
MIPRPYIIEWRKHAPWQSDAQVEQDLILSRVIIQLYNNPLLAENLLARGGTVLHKLFLAPAVRYSEDIDFVQKRAIPIGEIMGKIREICNPILGDPRTKQKKGRVVFVYRTDSELPPVVSLRIKIEINTREHFNILEIIDKSYKIESRWFSGESIVKTYSLEELLATKLRALYQRKKGRDLFDIWYAVKQRKVDFEKIIYSFKKYMDFLNLTVSRREFLENLQLKLEDKNFIDDIKGLIKPGISYSPVDACNELVKNLLETL